MSSIWRTIGRLDRPTLRAIALVCLADAIVGASFGALTVSGGLPAWIPIVMSLLVFAGGSQFAAAAVLIAGGSPVAAALAGLVLNARLLPYGFTVADVLGGRPGQPGQPSRPGQASQPDRHTRWWTRLLGAHLITDESVAFTMRQTDPHKRRAAFWTCGLGLFLCWNAAVALGVFAGSVMPNPDSFGLDAAFPAVIVALVLPSLTDRRTRTAALAGAVIAVAVTPVLPAGLPVLLALAGLALAIRKPSPSPAPSPAPNPAPAPSPDSQTTANLTEAR
jgi:predicted branched-subunit amino acid permease